MSWQEDTNQVDEELAAKNRAAKAVDQGVAELGAWANPPSQDELDAIGRGVKGVEGWVNGIGIVAGPQEPWGYLPATLGSGRIAGAGRPCKYTPQLVHEVITRLTAGEPLAKICRDEHMPSPNSIADWERRDETGIISAAIARARLDGYDAIAQDALDIADTVAQDVVETPDGPRVNSENIQRSRLRVETRLKLLAKWDPKRYGDAVTIKGDKDNPMAVTRYDLTDEQLLAIAAKGGA